MAPEYIETRKHQKVSDVFSIGLVCYELLTGEPAFSGEDVYQVLNAIANSEVKPPSKVNAEIDEGLDALILKSLEKDPSRRFSDAGSMLQALNDYLALDNVAQARDNSDATVRFLLRRMRHKKDFPAFSHTISVLNQASSSDTESLTTVSNTTAPGQLRLLQSRRRQNQHHFTRGGHARYQPGAQYRHRVDAVRTHAGQNAGIATQGERGTGPVQRFARQFTGAYARGSQS
jgi:serine/threonine protein kinase